MKHAHQTFEIKGDDADPEDVVGTALTELSETVTKRLDDLDAKADTKELEGRLDKIEAKMNRATDQGVEDVSEERKAFGVYLRKGSAATETELKALNITTDTQGGYLAPEELSTEMIRELTEYSPIRSVASVRGISSPSVKYPTRDSITNAQWAAEQAPQPESTVTFGQVEIAVHGLKTYVDISNDLLADSGGTAEAEVRMALAEDFGKKEGTAFVSGTGTGQPEGLLTHTGVASFAATSATLIKPDELIKMLYEMPATYRNAGTWLMNGTTLGILRTLKDGDGRFLWQPSFQAGQPETILGRPVLEAVDMPDIAKSATPILYGDFSAYRVVDSLSLSILVNPYILATNGVTRIHATRRVGGKVIQASRFRKLKMAAA